MIYGYKYEPLRNRLPTWIDRRWDIQGFGPDNLYPQRAKATRDASPTVKTACARYAEFLNGEGFADPALSSLIVNKKGHTANDFLDHIAEAMSWAGGFWVHVGYNLNYRICSLRVIPFEYNRFGLPDANGNFHDIKYSTNWEQDPYKEINPTMQICGYDRFNPDPNVVKEQMARAGGALNYKGQMFFWMPDDEQYSKATFDVVFDQAQTEEEIGILDLAMEQNGFKGGHVIMYPGKFESTQEEGKFKEGIDGFTGRGAGSALVIENPDGVLKADEIITTVQMQNTDVLHENVEKRVRGVIRRTFGMPMEIIGDHPEGGIFTKQQMEDAYTYYNSITKNGRNIISRQIKKLFTYWHQPVSGNFEIIPQQFISAPGAMVTPAAAPNVAQPGTAALATQAAAVPAGNPRAANINQTLTNLTGKQNQNYKRMLREFDEGKVNYARTKLALQTAFGFSDEEIVVIMGEEEQTAAA
jgi:hypothetical protein